MNWDGRSQLDRPTSLLGWDCLTLHGSPGNRKVLENRTRATYWHADCSNALRLFEWRTELLRRAEATGKFLKLMNPVCVLGCRVPEALRRYSDERVRNRRG